MFISNKISTPLMAALALSGVLHCMVIAGISGLDIFTVINNVAQPRFVATFISENTPGPLLARTTAQPRHPGAPLKQAVSLESTAPKKAAIEPDENTASITDPRTIPAKIQDGPTAVPTTIPAITPAMTPAITPAIAPDNRVALLKSSREKLSYNIYWLNIYVGKAVIEAVSNEGKIRISSQVHSAPVISAIYKVEDYAESTIINGVPVHFTIKQREGKYKSNKETVFDVDNKQVTFVNYLKGTRDEHTVNGAPLWDLISGFYYLRTQPFDIGKTIYINVFDSNKFFRAEVGVIARERISLSPAKELDTVKVKPVLKSEGLFQNKGDIFVWLTDDEDRTPVKIETKAPIGKVVAILNKRQVNSEK